MSRNQVICFLIGTLLLAPTGAFALPADARQPIEIEAEKMLLDQDKSIGTYTGNVILSQGSIRIEADRLVVYMRNNKLHRLEAFGSAAAQASFRQRLTNGEESRGHGGRVEYYAAESRLILHNRAELRQGGNHIQSERIDYNTASNSLLAGPNPQQDPAQGRQRVRIVIEPDDDDTSKKLKEQKQP